MTNIKRAQTSIEFLTSQGVREFVICAGARNAPFVHALHRAENLRTYSFFDERAAGFFALGRIKADRRPVAVCTTSGTAVAELLPSVVEADLQRLPLVLLTADRPIHYRGTGAPQTIEQIGIFSHYVEYSVDVKETQDLANLRLGSRPLHLNVPFSEDLVDHPLGQWSPSLGDWAPAPSSELELSKVEFSGIKRPLIIVSGLSESQAPGLIPLLKNWQRPLFLESTSLLRGHAELAGLEIRGGERSLKSLEFDGVIRIGGVPTLKPWRQWEEASFPVLNFSDGPWTGMPRANRPWPIAALFDVVAEFTPWTQSERATDFSHEARLTAATKAFPTSEPAWIQRLGHWVPDSSTVFVGNSLPIRFWDLVAPRGKNLQVHANRGANGIDGLISTFLGLAADRSESWCVLGDLSTLYDLNALWSAGQIQSRRLTIAVIHNGGGQIFERMFHDEAFLNSHDLNFAGWAQMWGWDYHRLEDPDAVPPVWQGRPRVLEIRPNAEATRAWHTMREEGQ
ncbi:MAG: 2-succinyl-5-enolpyruvyl-6-hydroxy-3-cyclohexene-1-carboxylic-acid synthase [Bdellovibrionales bacterium]